MRLNENVTVRGELITLVPYEECHVALYHSWMEAESLRQQTASERLSFEEELEMQKKWRQDEDKLTFIILTNQSTQTSEVDRMVGDVNLFFTQPNDFSTAEIEVMIADPNCRGKGYGAEALRLMILYAYESLRCGLFEAKIGVDNTASLKLFRRMGFKDLSFCEFFQEFHLQLNFTPNLKSDWLSVTKYELQVYHSDEMVRKVGIVGFGSIGEFLYTQLSQLDEFQVVFVWNRSPEKLEKLPNELILDDLTQFRQRGADLIVEVAHPSITKAFGPKFLEFSDYIIGSPTALADQQLLESLQTAAVAHGHTLYVPSGALWGGEDIRRMADRNTLKALKVTMTFHPHSLKLESPLKELSEAVKDKKTILFEGCVKDLCPLAPNNVNTMAAAAIAAHNLGFAQVEGCLIADPNNSESHVVEIEVKGPKNSETGVEFSVKTVRINPAIVGAVTGQATFNSFLSSVKGVMGVATE